MTDFNVEEAAKANAMTTTQGAPDGGVRAWLTVAGSSACFFVSFGWVNCIGVFQDYYLAHQLQAYTESEVSWIPALQSKCFLTLVSRILLAKLDPPVFFLCYVVAHSLARFSMITVPATSYAPVYFFTSSA